MDKHWKRDIVSLVSSVIVVMYLLISSVISMAIPYNVPAVSMADG